MIIRRKHTSNYTTIGNVLFNDERMAADEVGILAFLLSRPNDWEVRRPALMRRWGIGPVSMKRIFNKWMALGWCQAKKTRLSNGTFHIVYEIRDEPGRELTAEEIKEALSLVSSEASDDESVDLPPDEQPHDGDSPPPPHQGVADQGVVTGVVAKKESLSTDSQTTESTNGGRAFDDVKAVWPSEHVASLFACEKLHVELPDLLQDAAYQGMKPYLDDCRKSNRKVCDLATFYRERRWEKFASKAAQPGKTYAAKPGTPQWYRWNEYFHATNGPWRFMEIQARGFNNYTVPSEWPPAIQPVAAPPDPPKESSAA